MTKECVSVREFLILFGVLSLISLGLSMGVSKLNYEHGNVLCEKRNSTYVNRTITITFVKEGLFEEQYKKTEYNCSFCSFF